MVFWYAHNPAVRPFSVQYKSAIFYHDEEQKRLAEESWDNLKQTLGRELHTEIVPAGKFYMAEDYHQKYYLRQRLSGLLPGLSAVYPDIVDFTGSTAVARLNGYAGGYGTTGQLEEELELLGLSEKDQEIIRDIAGKNLLPACPVFIETT